MLNQQYHTQLRHLKIMKLKLLLVATTASLLSINIQADEAAGKMAYMTCSACHNADGQGLPLGDKKMAPSLVGSKIVNGDPSLLALVILKGIKKEGAEYMGMMAALELAYPDDQKLADVMTYVRQSFGNTAAAVTVEDAAKYRAQWQDVKEPVSRAKLAELLAAE
jgi:mono/diheme cytochrome c family protein